jgi:hypothetical protein
MMTDPWMDRLSEYADGELDAAGVREIELHLRSCQPCCDALSDLRRMRAAVRALPARPPDADLWPGVAVRLTPRERAVESAGPESPGRRWADVARRRWSFSLPQLAAAAAMLALAGAAAMWSLQPGTTDPELAGGGESTPIAVSLANFADPQFDAAVADLQQTLEAGRDLLDPKTIEILERNLRAIDDAITEARRALEADPANTFLNSHLAGARQRKLQLLRQAAAMAAAAS